MTGRDHVLARQPWRAPRAAGAALIEPPLVQAADLLATNRAALSVPGVSIFGRSREAAAVQSRQELVDLARQYTSAYREIPTAPPLGDAAPIFLAGHQPQLFHAGVWFKNFVLSSQAQRLGAHAVNLVVDNDTLRSAAIRVPSGSLVDPRIETVAFDCPGDEVPFEEREILDPDCFQSFGERAAAAIEPLVPRPLVSSFWPFARQAARRSHNLGRVIAEARHRLEAQCHLATLEVPLSLICETDAFREFSVGLLNELPRFREIHNSSLAEYRRVNRVRSRSHPVPDLAEEQGYLEAPFWLWTADNPRRRRLFARRHGDHLELTDRDRVRIDLPLAPAPAVAALRAQSAAGVRLRPRALITTMYARLFLCDLFLHGLGGGKYDQLTDAILARLFGLAPPAFLIATATLRLPIKHPVSTPEDLHRLDQRERDFRFHPERFLTPLPSEANRAVAEKAQWLAAELPRGQRRLRHQGIENANLALQPFLNEQRQSLAREREQVVLQLRTATLWGSREFAFCLFPREPLVTTLKKLGGTQVR